MSTILTGQVTGAEFVREETLPCDCVDFGGCCDCCTNGEGKPGTYLEVRLDGDSPVTLGGRVTIAYTSTPQSVLDVAVERATHAGRGWTAEHDAEHGTGHLTRIAGDHLRGLAADRVNHRSTFDSDRSHLVKAASLLVAAIDLLDAVAAGDDRG